MENNFTSRIDWVKDPNYVFPKVPTEKQTLARERNWTKFRLSGINIETKRLTTPELELVANIRKDLKTLLENFDTESASLGLNIRNKCWCRKIIKDNEKFCCPEHNTD